jgi:hypothetical protein
MGIVTQRGTVHIDKYLTNMSIKYASQQDKFIFPKVIPSLAVDKQSDKYTIFDTGAGRRIENDIVTDRTVPNSIISYKYSEDSFYCDPHALSDDYTPNEMINYDSPLDASVDTMEGVTENMMIIKEYNAANLLFSASNYGSNTAAATVKWDVDDGSAVDPRKQVDAAINTVRLGCGVRPNTMTINFPTYLALTRNPYVASYLSDAADKDVNLAKLAAFFKVENVYVGEATYATTKEGQTVSQGDLWTDNCLLAYIAPKPGLKRPSLAYTYEWKAYGTGKSMLVKKTKIERPEMTYIDVYNYYDQKMTMQAAGYLITDVLT